MHSQFKKFLIDSKQFAVLNEGLSKKLSLKIMALKIKEPKLKEQALKLAEKLQALAIAKVNKNRIDNFIMDNDLDKI